MPLLAFDEARSIVAEKTRQIAPEPPTQTLALGDLLGRVLAQVVHADRDYPPFNRSARDGYAVISSDVAQTPVRLRVIGETRAGQPSAYKIRPTETVEIMTGAPGPEGADAVVMFEHARRDGEYVTIEESVIAGRNLIMQGSEAAVGSVVLEPGVRLDYPHIALLASVGQAHAKVYWRPRVAIVSTGDEVIEVGAVPEPFQIRNSNAYSLAAQVRRQGGEPVILPIAPDHLDRTRELVQEGLKADMLLLSGGASSGKYDFIERVLSELGAEFFFTKVAIQPGKPLVFGQVAGKPVFGLPGNPISTMVTFRVFAAVALDLLAGLRASPLPFLQARLAGDFKHKPVLTRFLPAKLRGDGLGVEIQPLQSQGSGDVVALARADCFLVATTDRESWKSGDLISMLPL